MLDGLGLAAPNPGRISSAYMQIGDRVIKAAMNKGCLSNANQLIASDALPAGRIAAVVSIGALVAGKGAIEETPCHRRQIQVGIVLV